MSEDITIKPFKNRLEHLSKEEKILEKKIADFLKENAIQRSVELVLQDPLRICSEDYIALESKNINVEWTAHGIFFADQFLSKGGSIKIPALTISKKVDSVKDTLGEKINKVFSEKVLTDKTNTLELDAKYLLESYKEGALFVKVKFTPPEEITYIQWPRGNASARWIDFFDTEKDRDALFFMLQQLLENKKLQASLVSTIESIKKLVVQMITPAMKK